MPFLPFLHFVPVRIIIAYTIAPYGYGIYTSNSSRSSQFPARNQVAKKTPNPNFRHRSNIPIFVFTQSKLVIVTFKAPSYFHHLALGEVSQLLCGSGNGRNPIFIFFLDIVTR